jgi:hypothetical protein
VKRSTIRDGRSWEPKSHQVGVQVPRGVHAEVAQKGTVRGIEAIFRRGVHMMIGIPPKYAVSQVVGFIEGKSAIHLARVYGERKRNFGMRPQIRVLRELTGVSRLFTWIQRGFADDSRARSRAPSIGRRVLRV